MDALLDRPYWRRTWIIQEIVIADEVILYCGDSKINWCRFADFYAQIIDLTGSTNLKPTRGMPYFHGRNDHDNSRVDPINMLGESRDDWRGRGATADLSTAIRRFRRTECSDARDKVYALLSFAKSKPSEAPLRPNYEANRVELFFNVLEYCWTEALENNAVMFGMELRQTLDLQSSEIRKGLATRNDFIERLGASENQFYTNLGMSPSEPSVRVWTVEDVLEGRYDYGRPFSP